VIDLEQLVADMVRAEVARQLAERDAKPADGYLPIAAAAELAGVSPATVRRWCRDGKLTEHRVGDRVVRVRRADVERLLDGGGGESPEDAAVRRFG
jgi:excisionase family DNA binding protein